MTEKGQKIQVTVLGATGSIGTSTLDVLARHPDKYAVFALTALQNVDAMLKLCRDFSPCFAVMADPAAADALAAALSGSDISVLSGEAGLNTVAGHADCDTVVAAIVGAAGLRPTLCAVDAGKRVLLANKEALVMAGQLMMDAAARSGALLLPIDSEHNAIFQCLPQPESGLALRGVRKILLTASGGPFRQSTLEELRQVKPEHALKHPNWDMGQKVTIDSASLMNKGLELIEACWLFGVGPERIDVVVHPQSIVHSMVSYDDGSVLAQLGNPDMRTPIAHALAWPERISSGVDALDLIAKADLTFEAPDLQRFPCLRLAQEAAATGGTATTVLNAADEIAVSAFLQHRIGFLDIAAQVEQALQSMAVAAVDSVDILFEMDIKTRELVKQNISRTTLAVSS